MRLPNVNNLYSDKFGHERQQNASQKCMEEKTMDRFLNKKLIYNDNVNQNIIHNQFQTKKTILGINISRHEFDNQVLAK